MEWPKISAFNFSKNFSAMDILATTTAIAGIIIYFGGFLGNSFSILIFSQKELRKISTSLLFLLLNVFSTLHLLSLIAEFLDSIYNVQVIPNAVFRCQFLLWLQNTTRMLCSFLTTTITIDRFIRSEYPVHSRQLCTPKNVFRLFLIYILFASILHLFFFYPYNLFDAKGVCSWSYNSVFRLIAISIFPVVRFLFICVLPTIIMLGCSARMLYNIQKSRQRISRKTNDQHTTVPTINLSTSRATGTVTNQQRAKIAIDRMLLVMVLANVLAYIITQIPFNTYRIYYGYAGEIDYNQYTTVRSFLLMWSSIYFSIGFYLFCIASPQFRKQSLSKFKSIFFCYRANQRQMTSSRNT